ncbi:HNH endonuclease signature motif containing protein [Gryllotalpicola koreensis]|uniref:HNH endonuclease signature motif containing protein n=1 Tax=Gryllotalpicola koreensis TaxID=993086 RepID=A0ABP8A3E6_9MICO
MSIADQFDTGEDSSPGFGLSAGELAAAGRPRVLERVRQIDAAIAGLQAERVQLLGRLGEEAVMQAELDVEIDPTLSLDRRLNAHQRSLALELAAASNTGTDAAQRQLAEAWVLTQKCQVALLALSCGEISFGHALTIAREVADLDVLAAGEAQEALLPYARRLSPGLFAKKAREVLDANDTQRLHDRHRRAYERRNVSVDGARDGMATLSAYLDAADAAVIRTGLANAAREARQDGDSRTRGQLEADFLVELLMDGEVVTCDGDGEHAARADEAPAGDAGSDDAGQAASGSDGAGPAAARPRLRRQKLVDKAPISIEVLVPAATAAGDDAAPGRIPGIGMIDPVAARQLITRAPSLRRILTDPITSAILDFDRTTYRVPAELKRMIRIRDEHCRAPGCPRPPDDLDHTIDYAKGGTTSRENLSGLCENHHYVKHETGWTLRQYADGILDWRSPSGRRYQTRPDLIMPAPPPPDPWAQDWDAYADNTPFDKPSEDDE